MTQIEQQWVTWATIDRPGDVGMDLPPGAAAPDLKATDYHPVDMEQPEGHPDAPPAKDLPASARA